MYRTDFCVVLLCVSHWTEYLMNGNEFEKHSYILKIASKNTTEEIEKILYRLMKTYKFTKFRKIDNLGEDLYYFENHLPHVTRYKREALIDTILQEPDVLWIQEDVEIKRYKRRPMENPYKSQNYKFNDPLFPKMWYIRNDSKTLKIDMNITDVWNMGLTGKNVVVTILDDGIEHNHTDIANNYDPNASWDINSADPDPFPRYDQFNDNKHGTRCAGEVAAVANNNFCGVGVAYNAKIGGIRMLDGKVTDRVEAEALSVNPQHIDIYSSSWGPNDDGKSVEKPGILADIAFQNGISKGRGGLGNIFIWASGNGGHHGDDCNCDGYANSIYTLTVSSCTEHGGIPWYSESCAVTLVSTPSSGSYGQQKIITTDLKNTCTDKHTGTSASAPLLAGIVALAIEANRNLSWRDVQHMLVWSANPNSLLKNDGWTINGVGLKFNKKFGFGLVDTYAMISMVTHSGWYSVGTISNTCESAINQTKLNIYARQSTIIVIQVSSCSNSILYLEYVQLMVSVDSEYRGHLSIDLISPYGTVSNILSFRPEDSSKDGFVNWRFNTAHMWGENPDGLWRIIFNDRSPYHNDMIISKIPVGRVVDCQLQFFGSLEEPFYQRYYHHKIQQNIPNNMENRVRRQELFTEYPTYSPITYMADNRWRQIVFEHRLMSAYPEFRYKPPTINISNYNVNNLEKLLKYLTNEI